LKPHNIKISLLAQALSERWLKCRNEDASKKILVATGILAFDFEPSIGNRIQQVLNYDSLPLIETIEGKSECV
jgi:hypothetical protein